MNAMAHALVRAAELNPDFTVRRTDTPPPPAPKPQLVIVPANIFEALSNKALKLRSLELRQAEDGTITIIGRFDGLENAVVTVLKQAQDFVLQTLFQKALARNAKVSVIGSSLGQRLVGRQLTMLERTALDCGDLESSLPKEVRLENGFPLYE